MLNVTSIVFKPANSIIILLAAYNLFRENSNANKLDLVLAILAALFGKIFTIFSIVLSLYRLHENIKK